MDQINQAGGLQAVMAAARAGAPEAIKLLTSMTKAWDAEGSDLTHPRGGDLAQADQDSINAGMTPGEDMYPPGQDYDPGYTGEDYYRSGVFDPGYTGESFTPLLPDDLGDLTSFDLAYGY
jgi:hypothetical protein